VRVIFLDFDGVLNSNQFFESQEPFDRSLLDLHEEAISELDPKAVARLKGLLDKTGAHIVLSTSWRMLYNFEDIKVYLREAGLLTSQVGRIIGATPRFYDEPRGSEIKAWLDNTSEEVEAYVIFDDNPDMLPDQEPFFVKTSMKTGITGADVEKAQKILGFGG